MQYSFKRYEKKFLLTPAQFEAILPVLREKMSEEQYGLHTVCNIYYDTDAFDLIRTSVDKPPYKEKFRLRSYGTPGSADTIFAEIKKKFNGVVYKRRVAARPSEIADMIEKGQALAQNIQIQREIQWFLAYYHPRPRVFIGYERVAFEGLSEPYLRITFDRHIRWRREKLDLRMGDEGQPVLPDDRIVMEVKTPEAIPLWLVELLSRERIYVASFSKYGICYQRHIAAGIFSERIGNHV